MITRRDIYALLPYFVSARAASTILLKEERPIGEGEYAPCESLKMFDIYVADFEDTRIARNLRSEMILNTGERMMKREVRQKKLINFGLDVKQPGIAQTRSFRMSRSRFDTATHVRVCIYEYTCTVAGPFQSLVAAVGGLLLGEDTIRFRLSQ